MTEPLSGAFLQDLRTLDLLKFQLAPRQIKESSISDIKKEPIAGIDYPRIVAFLQGGRELEFTLDFYAEDRLTRDSEFVQASVDFLIAATLNAPLNDSPNPVMGLVPHQLGIGSFMTIPVYVQSVQVTWEAFEDPILLRPIMAQVAVKLIAAPQNVYLSSTVARTSVALRSAAFVFDVG